MFSVPSVIAWFGNAKDITLRELCVNRSKARIHRFHE